MGPNREQTAERDTPFSIPKLSSDGSNLVTFKTSFLYAMGSCDAQGHFNGSEKTPSQPTLSSFDKSKWTVADIEQNEAYLRSERKWWHDKKVACVQLAQVV